MVTAVGILLSILFSPPSPSLSGSGRLVAPPPGRGGVASGGPLLAGWGRPGRPWPPGPPAGGAPVWERRLWGGLSSTPLFGIYTQVSCRELATIGAQVPLVERSVLFLCESKSHTDPYRFGFQFDPRPSVHFRLVAERELISRSTVRLPESSAEIPYTTWPLWVNRLSNESTRWRHPSLICS